MRRGVQAESTVNNQNTEDDLKSLSRILSIIQNLKTYHVSYIFETRQHISGRHLNLSGYPLQQVVELFRNLLFQLEVARLTHTYHVVFRFCELENISYLVLRYLNTSALPFEEWAEEWLFDREV